MTGSSIVLQCSSNGGVCPDTELGGKQDVSLTYASVTDHVVRIRYSRPLQTNDLFDQEYLVDGTEQQIVWAIGPLNTKREAAKHYSDDRIVGMSAQFFHILTNVKGL